MCMTIKFFVVVQSAQFNLNLHCPPPSRRLNADNFGSCVVGVSFVVGGVDNAVCMIFNWSVGRSVGWNNSGEFLWQSNL